MYELERPVWAQVDLDQLAENMRAIQRAVPGKRIMSVVKGDAYGHGMIPVARTFKSCGIRDFAVALLGEAVELREKDPESTIMVLGYSDPRGARIAISEGITSTVFDYSVAEEFSKEACRLGKEAKIAIVLDSGMGRIGYVPSPKTLEEIQAIAKLPGLRLEEFFSHFATADARDPREAKRQLARYEAFRQELAEVGVHFKHYHMANSAAILNHTGSLMDTVRPGIIQYGYYPRAKEPSKSIKVSPVLTWKTKLIQVKEVAQGTPIGYSQTWRAPRTSLIGTIPLGYADGLTRALSNKGRVLIRGAAAPIRGLVCMDQCMVDLTQIPKARVGDEVTVLGTDGGAVYDADDMAKDLSTISYEVLCDISRRVPRKYIHGKKEGQ
ncbi:Alanine racemase [Clostridiaceae bacterium JG1575]|nr:Alanine racemase [Clostridiaceae bacterium JG1575]